MQKFVIKKISRSTNITISSTEDQNLSQCSDQVQLKPPPPDDCSHLETLASSVKMCGYLKKKRNFGGWTKLFFVLQNSLLMSYNSREEYEEHLKSFKDVILIIPGTTVLLPSLEPRFTIASNLNTFYTFRCDDNKTCSKWITALLECLSRDVTMEFINGKRAMSSSSSSSASSTSAPRSPVKNFFSHQNLNAIGGDSNNVCHRSKYSKKHPSWENLQGPRQMCRRHQQKNVNFTSTPPPNWIVNHNGRILLELNMLNCNRAKLPIASQTAKILKNSTDSDVIRTTKKINFLHKNDENGNGNCHETKVAHDTHHILEKPDQFRLHNDGARKAQSREVNRISKMFPATSESESPRAEKLTQPNGIAEANEIGVEEQEQAMSFGEEYYSLFATGDYASVDSSRFNNKLSIEENTYSEVEANPNGRFNVTNEYAIPIIKTSAKWIKSTEPLDLPEYSVVDLTKKYQQRLDKVKREAEKQEKGDESEKVNQLLKNLNIYEDIEIKNGAKSDEGNIYELIEIPSATSTTSSQKMRSLIWRNFLDFAKRFKDTSSSTTDPPVPVVDGFATMRKRQKYSRALSDLSRHFNYRSMRSKAKKFYRKSNSTSALPPDFAVNDEKARFNE